LSFWLLYITGTSDVHFGRRDTTSTQPGARRSDVGDRHGSTQSRPGSERRVPATFNTDETWALPTHNPAHIRCA
jgi:hypothetical protein